MTAQEKKDFPFIVLSNGPNGPRIDDPKARRIIRKQAMKDIGELRKKKGNYGKVNMRQSPPHPEGVRTLGYPNSGTDVQIRASASISNSDLSDSADDTESTGSKSARSVVPSKRSNSASWDDRYGSGLTAINLFTDYEAARATFCIDLTALSILTNFNVGKSTIPILSADPTRLAALLGHKQRSYLQYVPGVYGTSECVTAATNCVLAKAKLVLSPKESSKEMSLRLYTRALQSLQAAIANGIDCTTADILCATQLLSLHEVSRLIDQGGHVLNVKQLLDPSRDTAWSHHINGSARLIKHRAAHRFTTEFDKALFAAHVGPIVSECLMGNTHCYLEEPEWSTLYASLAQESNYLTDRSPLAIDLRLIMFQLPGLWHDVGAAVTGTALYDDDEIMALESRCRDSHCRLIDWMEDYKAHCVRLSLAAPPPTELALRRELFGAALECLVIVKRLLATVCDVDRPSLETDTQALAQLILDLQKQPSPKHSWLFSGHEVGVAYTVMLTKNQWEAAQDYESDEERRMAMRDRYNTWSNTLRMTG